MDLNFFPTVKWYETSGFITLILPDFSSKCQFPLITNLIPVLQEY